jgi:hypothetical protein
VPQASPPNHRARSLFQETSTPPPIGTPLPSGKQEPWAGLCPAIEVSIKTGNNTPEVNPRPSGKPLEYGFQQVTRQYRVAAVAAGLGVRQNRSRFGQIPPTLRKRRGDGTSPQPIFLQLTNRHTRQRGDTTNATYRNTSSGPPSLSAQPLRPPTRHRPFGLTRRTSCHTERHPGAGFRSRPRPADQYGHDAVPYRSVSFKRSALDNLAEREVVHADHSHDPGWRVRQRPDEPEYRRPCPGPRPTRPSAGLPRGRPGPRRHAREAVSVAVSSVRIGTSVPGPAPRKSF